LKGESERSVENVLIVLKTFIHHLTSAMIITTLLPTR
jgi:hypothetical protein